MKSTYRPSKQQGAALAVGLFFLLILTIIGLTAVRSTTQQARMAASYQFQTVAFQGAESVIRRVLSEVRGDIPRPVTATMNLIDDAIDGVGVDPTRSHVGSPGVTSFATVTYRTGGTTEDYSLGGKIAPQRFSIRAVTAVTNTNAQAEHEQGIERIGPASGLN